VVAVYGQDKQLQDAVKKAQGVLREIRKGDRKSTRLNSSH